MISRKFKVKSSKLKVLILLLAAGCWLLVALSACGPQKERVYRKSRILMDTVITISAVSDSGNKAEAAIDNAFSEVEKIGNLVNFFSDKSEISEINRNAGLKPVKVSAETLEIIERAIYTSEKTNGAFDVTIGPEISLWDFHKKIKPDDKTIKQRLPLVNYKNLIINKKEQTVYLRQKGMLVDPGGIAKGFAADRAVRTLKNNDIKAGLVAIAGDIRAFGLKPDGKPWKIGIKNPRAENKNDEIMAIIELTDAAISTSGDYERYFVDKGKRYHHILNPKTGYPAEGCRSVSVIAKEGAITDSFSTAIFILGQEKGMRLLEDMGIGGIIVDKDGKIYTTPDLRGKFEIKRDS